jgi:hypothetical protein
MTTAAKIWALGCIVFAALSGYLGLKLVSVDFDQYTRTVQSGFLVPRCEALMGLISKVQPPLRRNQLLEAAKVANVPVEDGQTFLRIADNTTKAGGGIVFTLSGDDVVSLRNTW